MFHLRKYEVYILLYVEFIVNNLFNESFLNDNERHFFVVEILFSNSSFKLIYSTVHARKLEYILNFQ